MKLTQRGFKGGLVDSPNFPDLSCGSEIENFIINKDGDLLGAPGISLFSSSVNRVPTASRISSISELGNGYVAISNRRAYFFNETSLAEILGPSGNPALSNGNSESITSVAKYNNQLLITSDSYANPIRVWINGATGTPKVTQAGLPQLPTVPTVAGSGTGFSYIYAFTYKYEYLVGNSLFVNISAPVYVEKIKGAAISSSNTDAISAIPTLSNGTTGNYDTANIKVQIYRTQNNSTTFYLVGEVNSGTTTFTDKVPDSTLVNNEPLYTNGGLRPNHAPPLSSKIFSANDVYYYMCTNESGDIKDYRLLQSITNDPSSVPSDYIVDFSSPIVGGGVVGRSPVVFTENQVVRLDGVIDDAGLGVINKEVISNIIGGISHGSIVKTNMGLYFAGTDGFYFTNGFSAPTKLAKKGSNASKIDGFYPLIIATKSKRDRILGAYDSINNLVFWACQDTATDNDVIYVYHEAHDSFTRIKLDSGVLVSSILPTKNGLIIGDVNGYIFRMSFDYSTVPRVDVNTSVSSWVYSAINYVWRSVNIDAGDSAINKWFRSINVQGRPETNLDMNIKTYVNGETDFKTLHPLDMRPSLTWGDSLFIWGNESLVWGVTLPMNKSRRFSHGRLRARQRQIEFSNSYALIETQAVNVTIDSVTKTATLPPGEAFAEGSVGYSMRINEVDYEILTQGIDSMTLLDPNNSLVSGLHSWGIYGHPKGQRPHIEQFSVDYETLTEMGTKFHGEAP